MIKSVITKREYQAIYRVLNRVSPLETDCGELCGAACCTAELKAAEGEGRDGAPEMGIYLLPGEDKLFDKHEDWLSWSSENAEDYDFPESWRGKVFFVRCKTPPKCPREKRPIQCRTFPLLPHIDEDGVLSLVYNDLELPYRCPLIEEEIPLEDRFYKATLTAWKHLIRDPLIYDLVRQDSLAREEALTELYEKLML